MPMTMDEAHAHEDHLREQFKKKFPEEKIPYHGSTWKAIDYLEERIYGFRRS